MCLPHCPTYQLLRNEADSPRGRIALMQAYASGQLETSPALITHLDRCLACRACERMCPSKVEYGKLEALGESVFNSTLVKDHNIMLENIDQNASYFYKVTSCDQFTNCNSTLGNFTTKKDPNVVEVFVC